MDRQMAESFDKLTLKREHDTFEITAATWAETLLKVEDYGWKPQKPRLHYYAGDTEVSDDEVTGIYEGLENLFDAALKDPMRVYPIKVDMGELYEIKEFIKEGSFTVEHAS
jgi:hypothetical protein